jgi:hypothetical protein
MVNNHLYSRCLPSLTALLTCLANRSQRRSVASATEIASHFFGAEIRAYLIQTPDIMTILAIWDVEIELGR